VACAGNAPSHATFVRPWFRLLRLDAGRAHHLAELRVLRGHEGAKLGGAARRHLRPLAGTRSAMAGSRITLSVSVSSFASIVNRTISKQPFPCIGRPAF
jgi:hypothetical protein